MTASAVLDLGANIPLELLLLWIRNVSLGYINQIYDDANNLYVTVKASEVPGEMLVSCCSHDELAGTVRLNKVLDPLGDVFVLDHELPALDLARRKCERQAD